MKDLKYYVNQMTNDEKNANGARAIAAFHMLSNVDEMIEAFFYDKGRDHGEMLIDVFGLLQALFVGVDALYDLSIGLTSYKYHININQNNVLHTLKYIRNDIVGHPTHRTYSQGGQGFSILDMNRLSKENIYYKTYIYKKNRLEIKETEVKFSELTQNYKSEKEKLILDLVNYLSLPTKTTELPEKVYRLFETLNEELLSKVKASFCDKYQLGQTCNHRFIWRANLLSVCLKWHHDDFDLNQLITYMAKIQASKMYKIALDIEERSGEKIHIAMPQALTGFYRFVRQNEKKALPLMQNLHDMSHPLFETDLQEIKQLQQSKWSKLILDWLQDVKEETKVYLIGSILRAYRPKR
jgi:hypothetical protein